MASKTGGRGFVEAMTVLANLLPVTCTSATTSLPVRHRSPPLTDLPGHIPASLFAVVACIPALMCPSTVLSPAIYINLNADTSCAPVNQAGVG